MSFHSLHRSSQRNQSHESRKQIKNRLAEISEIIDRLTLELSSNFSQFSPHFLAFKKQIKQVHIIQQQVLKQILQNPNSDLHKHLSDMSKILPLLQDITHSNLESSIKQLQQFVTKAAASKRNDSDQRTESPWNSFNNSRINQNQYDGNDEHQKINTFDDTSEDSQWNYEKIKSKLGITNKDKKQRERKRRRKELENSQDENLKRRKKDYNFEIELYNQNQFFRSQKQLSQAQSEKRGEDRTNHDGKTQLSFQSRTKKERDYEDSHKSINEAGGGGSRKSLLKKINMSIDQSQKFSRQAISNLSNSSNEQVKRHDYSSDSDEAINSQKQFGKGGRNQRNQRNQRNSNNSNNSNNSRNNENINNSNSLIPQNSDVIISQKLYSSSLIHANEDQIIENEKIMKFNVQISDSSAQKMMEKIKARIMFSCIAITETEFECKSLNNEQIECRIRKEDHEIKDLIRLLTEKQIWRSPGKNIKLPYEIEKQKSKQDASMLWEKVQSMRRKLR